MDAFPRNSFQKNSFILISFFLICFIRNSPAADLIEPDGLVAQITIPYSDSLIRGDVPVYGLAYGDDFKEYILEYGNGSHPRKWIVINQSDKPEKNIRQLDTVDFSLVKTIPGNLGMWETGLSEYTYKQYDVDLPMGEYTLRLRAKGNSGKEKVDEVLVRVGRVILNCESGTVESPDKGAKLFIPEHSLDEAAKVFSLTELSRRPQSLDKIKLKLLSPLYRLQPAGQMFTQNAHLRILVDQLDKNISDQLSIYFYDVKSKQWLPLEGRVDIQENYLEAELSMIPEKFAIFGVFQEENAVPQKQVQKTGGTSQSASSVLCRNEFEKDIGQWKNKHGDKGAKLDIVENGCVASRCLKISNIPGGGNFAAQAWHQEYDFRRYPIIDFDYKVSPDTKVNILLKGGDRWFDIPFTDDEKVYWDINMEPVERPVEVKADGQWHHWRADIRTLLTNVTDEFMVYEIVFADWDSTGFKQLEYGTTPAGAKYFIDNFQISSDYFSWKIGNVDHSSEEFQPTNGDLKDDVYMLGQPVSIFPSQSDSALKIKFDAPESVIQRIYRLTVRLAEASGGSNFSQIKLAYGKTEVPDGQCFSSDLRMDCLLKDIKPGGNEFILNNFDSALGIDTVEFSPLGEPPWVVEISAGILGGGNIFIEESQHSSDPQITAPSSASSTADVYFAVSALPSDLNLEIVPFDKSNASWLDLSMLDIFLNGTLLKKVTYGASGEAVHVPAPRNQFKLGINVLRLSPSSGTPLQLKRISLE